MPQRCNQPLHARRRIAGYGLEAESLPGELTEDISGADVRRSGWARRPVSEVRFLMDTLGIANLVGDSGIRTFGWVEGGYTGASTGAGMLSVQPRQNRFGDEFLLNQIGWAIQKPLQQDQFDWGFNMRYFAGADAALGAAKGASASRRAIRSLVRTSATFTCRRTCRSSPTAAWT